ncbi:hypothetical protein I316_02690 [Kwoniella heveanensis BCC8398]|uniref:Uracil-DNA glycosylase-like domain-containing protein n=1 Tax=Kwoniella heveanensis BCC8398 TaxID=1296120 RepID=A0A1B9GXG1_9TREE|nr:hypothetical protein I316_02690 [Kwoniella heveanensis BCC8398]
MADHEHKLNSEQSPASKAFADRLAKYAYMVSDQATSSSSTASSFAAKLPVPNTRVLRSSTLAVENSKKNEKSGRSEADRSRKTLQLTYPDKRRRGSRSRSRDQDDDDEYGDGESYQRLDLVEDERIEFERDTEYLDGAAASERTRKRKRQAVEGSSMPSEGKSAIVKGKNQAKVPRGYAPPEAYEHLRPVNDLLREGLEVVFCGINPGKRSSTMGHHFSHPTNKFWVSLTPRLLDPTEDYLMVQEFNFGLTNLVDRPTSEQSELSTLEMRLNVYKLTQKFLKHKPKVVCFVGKKIWDVYESVVRKTSVPVEADVRMMEQDTPDHSNAGGEVIKKEPLDIDQVKLEPIAKNLTSRASCSLSVPPLKVEPAQADIKPDLQSADTSYANRPSSIAQSNPPSPLKPVKKEESVATDVTKQPSRKLHAKAPKAPVQPFDPTKPRRFRLPHACIGHVDSESALGIEAGRTTQSWTYFWVVPNTSGLERTQLPQQVINFTALRVFTESLDRGWTLPATEDGWLDIDPDGVRQTVDQIRAAQLPEGIPRSRSVHSTSKKSANNALP